MMAARCGPKRANFDAIEKARGQSPARIAACTFESFVCNTALLWPSALYGAREHREAGAAIGFLPVFRPQRRNSA